MAIKQINVNVNDSILRSAHMIADKRNKTIDEVLSEMLEKGIADTEYRMKRNAQKWQEQKAEKEQIERIKSKLTEMGVDVENL